jgi:hypothetical protein
VLFVARKIGSGKTKFRGSVRYRTLDEEYPLLWRGIGSAVGIAKGRACNRTDERITVPRYFFNVRNHIHTQDLEGADLADLATAKREALKDILDILKARSNVVGEYWQSWSIEICDLNRKVVLVVPFSND